MSFVDKIHTDADWATRLADDRGLAGNIASQIRQAILTGALVPGQKINEEELSSTFATSRTPVREALRILESERLVIVVPRRGARVSELAPEEAADAYLCRAYFYGLAAKLAALRRKEEDVASLYALLAKLEKITQAPGDEGSDKSAYLDGMAQLNAKIVAISGSSHISELLKPLDLKALRYRHLSLGLPHRKEQAKVNYQRIIEAIKAKDAAEAEHAARVVIAEGGEALLKSLEQLSGERNLTIMGLI